MSASIFHSPPIQTLRDCRPLSSLGRVSPVLLESPPCISHQPNKENEPKTGRDPPKVTRTKPLAQVRLHLHALSHVALRGVPIIFLSPPTKEAILF